ncbi:MAG: diacylglycerol/lipid kinase family protein [Pseudomonadota bacterium]
MPGVLIVNPFASRVTPERIERVAAALGDPEVVLTERPGHATELVRDLGGGVEALYVFSGDGVFNEVLNGAGGTVPLGFVPGGGTSVLPRALGLPRDPVAAARALAHARPRRIGLGRVNGRRFGFSAGIGLDAELVRRVDALGRDASGRRAGDVRFTLTALRVLAEHRVRFDPVLEVDGVGSAAFLLVANTDPYTYAGPVPLRLARGARFEGGLDAVGPRRLRLRHVPGALAYLAAGVRALPLLELHDADRIVVRAERPQPLQADGEDLGDVTTAVLEAERDAVTVLVP